MDKKTKQELIRKLLKRLAPEEDRIESIEIRESVLDSASAMESTFSGNIPDEKTASEALEGISKNKSLTEDQLHSLEAIIIPGERPVVDIIGGSYSRPEAPFRHFDRRVIRRQIEAAIPAIGRVELFNHPAPYGGTAFVVGDGIMMTNRHVAELFANGLGRNDLQFRAGISAGVDLKREIINEDEGDTPDVLTVEKILMIHPYWDMALLQVKGLEDIEPLTLATVAPEELIGQDIAVVGYPAFDSRNRTDLQNQIFRNRFNVKRMQPGVLRRRERIGSYGNRVNAITHDSSTLGGNSGSAVIDVGTGQVVALHFAGVYLHANYAVPAIALSRDRRVIEAGLNFDGTARPEKNEWDSAWDSVDRIELTRPELSGLGVQNPRVVSRSNIGNSGSATWTIPFEVTVSVGGQPQALTVNSDTSSDSIERVVEPFHEENYEERPGYDEEFLGIRIPLPTVKNKRLVSRFNRNQYVLPYHHFSLVMHRKRRLAMYTASNIDGRPEKQRPESGRQYNRSALARMGENDSEKWFTDPRIPANHQLPNKFYNKDRQSFDKGHLVKREDVCWGDSYSEIEKANGDTFHVTNCSPQVLHFNRSNRNGIWGKLENEIIKQARKEDEKYVVFSGPILAKRDPEFFGVDDESGVQIQIPVRFWKVIVVREGNQLECHAFILEQDLSRVKFTEGTFEEFKELTFDEKWNEYRISIADLEGEVRLLEFPERLHEADMF